MVHDDNGDDCDDDSGDNGNENGDDDDKVGPEVYKAYVPPVNLPVKMEFRYEIEVPLYSDMI
ncbi:LOW QUALITY PROTEIN: hypothetical protein U9M48_027146 [Paspalum notatum var. saurae]|uniref:Uncharacterized protein n=1 Tax=Paspalum notatum var. saurae TaxID=547442 RepID=A0AAQ3WZR2_PASNO